MKQALSNVLQGLGMETARAEAAAGAAMRATGIQVACLALGVAAAYADSVASNTALVHNSHTIIWFALAQVIAPVLHAKAAAAAATAAGPQQPPKSS